MLVPEQLRAGDTLAISCPSGFMDAEKILKAVHTFEEWGLNVKVGDTLSFPSLNYFSAPDELKIEEMQQFLDDEKVKAVFMGRGGYGMSRIIDALDFSMFRGSPKWICGFSDITLFHLHLQSMGYVSLHSPMCSAFNLVEEEIMEKNILYIRKALMEGGLMEYHYDIQSPYVRSGTAEGILIGGNLAMITHALGSASVPEMENAILFIEDIGEHIYKIDRMLYQLKRAGVLDKIKAVIVGRFSEIEDTIRPFGKCWEEVIYDHFKELNIPVAFGFPSGHEDLNLSLKLGKKHRLEINYPQVKLVESIN